MSAIISKTDDFLRGIHMHPQQTDIAATSVDIMLEMERGLRGKPSSVAMIPTFIPAHAEPPDGEPVIVADAGGTNLRVGLCVFRGGKPVVSDISRCAVPGSRGELEADDFFGELADVILPYTKKSSRIGFSFSYPAEIFPNRDGRIIRLNKELRVKGAAGAIVGSSIKKKLAEKGAGMDYSFTLLNDTTASLLGGIATAGDMECGGLAGVVLGTGSNSCCLEKGENIKKLHDAEDMIVNCESGNFSGAHRGEADLLTDESSEIPGDHLFEKMVSGAYIGTVITNTALLASGEGLLSDGFTGIRKPFTPEELDGFLRGETGRASAMCSGSDAEVLRYIIDAAYERAARLVCADISALCLHSDGGKSAEKPFCVIAEGSTFYNSLLFYDKLKKQIDDYIYGSLHRYVVCRNAGNSTLAGAAYAVFTLKS